MKDNTKTSKFKINAGCRDNALFIEVYDLNDNVLLSLPEDDKKYQGHFVEDDRLYIAMYTPEIGPATYEFTESGLVLKETYSH